jgi:hypothetical protein
MTRRKLSIGQKLRMNMRSMALAVNEGSRSKLAESRSPLTCRYEQSITNTMVFTCANLIPSIL